MGISCGQMTLQDVRAAHSKGTHSAWCYPTVRRVQLVSLELNALISVLTVIRSLELHFCKCCKFVKSIQPLPSHIESKTLPCLGVPNFLTGVRGC